jgi:hypothetical protein
MTCNHGHPAGLDFAFRRSIYSGRRRGHTIHFALREQPLPGVRVKPSLDSKNEANLESSTDE